MVSWTKFFRTPGKRTAGSRESNIVVAVVFQFILAFALAIRNAQAYSYYAGDGSHWLWNVINSQPIPARSFAGNLETATQNIWLWLILSSQDTGTSLLRETFVYYVAVAMLSETIYTTCQLYTSVDPHKETPAGSVAVIWWRWWRLAHIFLLRKCLHGAISAVY